jgi:hypothetical protein
MPTLYLLIMAALGGLLVLFVVAGWSSYTQKKLPETPILFRWFITGLLGSGIAAYTWVFGAGGDPSKLLETVSDALEVQSVVEGLSSAVGGTATEIATKYTEAASEIMVGMPSF